MMLTGEPPVFNEEWAERIKPEIADHGKEKTVQEMQFSEKSEITRRFIEIHECGFSPALKNGWPN